MSKALLNIDEAILASNKIICRQISRLGESSRGEISQEVLESLRHFVEHILLKVYAKGNDIEDTQKNITAAVKEAKASPDNSDVKHISRFHHFLQVSASHRVLKEQNAERLMLKYYEYLLRIRNFLHEEYSLDVLENLETFPLETDKSVEVYYRRISEKIRSYQNLPNSAIRCDRFYVQKIKPFFVDGKIYYEVSLVPANDNSSKTDRIIAFTELEISGFYAVRLGIFEDYVEILDTIMPIRIISKWETSIRPCEFKNFSRIVYGRAVNYGSTGLKRINEYLTETGFNLSEIVLFSDEAFSVIRSCIVGERETHSFFECLEKCRDLINRNAPGSTVLRYLLYHMSNRVIKKQYWGYCQWDDQDCCGEHIGGNSRLSNLFLNYKCIPFDEMPFCSGLVGHVPGLFDLLDCFDTADRTHELLARYVQTNTEQNNILFTRLEKTVDGKYRLGAFEDVAVLAQRYNDRLYTSVKQQMRKLIIKYDHIFIQGYEEDTVAIIQKIKSLSSSGIENYSNLVNYWLQNTDQVNSDERRAALLNMFTASKVALIYGSAGTGKTYLINHISNLFADKSRIYLAQTNPAVNNLRRKIAASANSKFMTIAKFTSPYYKDKTDFDILIIDECSTVNNRDMRAVLEHANFELLVLVGDTHQIESIEFGNWFACARSFLPQTSVCELTKPYRSDSDALLKLWNDVRKMEDDIFELLQTYGYSAKLDESVFTPAAENEIILCLNYGGLYGINNINYFLQQNNRGKEIWRGVQRYKVGDPILFNDSADRFFVQEKEQVPIIHNNMKGRIVDFYRVDEGKATEAISFDIEIDRPLIEMDSKKMDFEIVSAGDNGNSVIRFAVYNNKGSDEDDDNNSKTVVPFQIAYATSIHKAQGLEYDSVKIIITDEVDELITHSIFYTAITRARKSLKIYWTEKVERSVTERIKPRDNKKDVILLKQELVKS